MRLVSVNIYCINTRLTTYAIIGRPHPKDCGIPNCDNPIHFPGGEDGKLRHYHMHAMISEVM